MILLLAVGFCTSTTLKCSFHDDFVFRKYGCKVTELENGKHNSRITLMQGQHVESLSNADVKCLRIEKLASVEFFTNDFFVKFPNIQNLVIHEAPLKFLLRGDFALADNLVNVYIANTELTDLEDYVFHGTKVLKTLNLRENKIRQIAGNAFKGLATLKFLTLSSNEIESLHDNLFKDLSFLEQLTLSFNRIRHIDEHLFSKNRNLQVIFLDHNQLSAINGNMFRNNHELREIYMDNNHIKHVSNIPSFLTNLKGLEVAVFSNNSCVDSMFLIMNNFHPPYASFFERC